MPEMWKKADITVIPKEGLDLTLTRRVVSVLNNDYKLFNTILGERLKIIWEGFIYKD